jgi:hypothetical protein
MAEIESSRVTLTGLGLCSFCTDGEGVEVMLYE